MNIHPNPIRIWVAALAAGGALLVAPSASGARDQCVCGAGSANAEPDSTDEQEAESASSTSTAPTATYSWLCSRRGPHDFTPCAI